MGGRPLLTALMLLLAGGPAPAGGLSSIGSSGAQRAVVMEVLSSGEMHSAQEAVPAKGASGSVSTLVRREAEAPSSHLVAASLLGACSGAGCDERSKAGGVVIFLILFAVVSAFLWLGIKRWRDKNSWKPGRVHVCCGEDAQASQVAGWVVEALERHGCVATQSGASDPNAIQSADLALVVLKDACFRSERLMAELTLAWQANTTIIPVHSGDLSAKQDLMGFINDPPEALVGYPLPSEEDADRVDQVRRHVFRENIRDVCNHEHQGLCQRTIAHLVRRSGQIQEKKGNLVPASHYNHDFFITYTTKDATQAFESISSVLRAMGCNVFNPGKDLQATQVSSEEMKKHVRGSLAVIQVNTPMYTESKWCRGECLTAIDKGIPLFPVYAGFTHTKQAIEAVLDAAPDVDLGGPPAAAAVATVAAAAPAAGTGDAPEVPAPQPLAEAQSSTTTAQPQSKEAKKAEAAREILLVKQEIKRVIQIRQLRDVYNPDHAEDTAKVLHDIALKSIPRLRRNMWLRRIGAVVLCLAVLAATCLIWLNTVQSAAQLACASGDIDDLDAWTNLPSFQAMPRGRAAMVNCSIQLKAKGDFTKWSSEGDLAAAQRVGARMKEHYDDEKVSLYGLQALGDLAMLDARELLKYGPQVTDAVNSVTGAQGFTPEVQRQSYLFLSKLAAANPALPGAEAPTTPVHSPIVLHSLILGMHRLARDWRVQLAGLELLIAIGPRVSVTGCKADHSDMCSEKVLPTIVAVLENFPKLSGLLEKAARAILSLAKKVGNAIPIVDVALSPLVKAVSDNEGHTVLHGLLAELLDTLAQALASNPGEIQEMREKNTLPPLVRLLGSNLSSEDSVFYSVRAMQAQAAVPGGPSALEQAGAIDALVSILGRYKQAAAIVQPACEILRHLAAVPAMRPHMAAKQVPEAAFELVRTLDSAVQLAGMQLLAPLLDSINETNSSLFGEGGVFIKGAKDLALSAADLAGQRDFKLPCLGLLTMISSTPWGRIELDDQVPALLTVLSSNTSDLDAAVLVVNLLSQLTNLEKRNVSSTRSDIIVKGGLAVLESIVASPAMKNTSDAQREALVDGILDVFGSLIESPTDCQEVMANGGTPVVFGLASISSLHATTRRRICAVLSRLSSIPGQEVALADAGGMFNLLRCLQRAANTSTLPTRGRPLIQLHLPLWSSGITNQAIHGPSTTMRPGTYYVAAPAAARVAATTRAPGSVGRVVQAPVYYPPAILAASGDGHEHDLMPDGGTPSSLLDAGDSVGAGWGRGGGEHRGEELRGHSIVEDGGDEDEGTRPEHWREGGEEAAEEEDGGDGDQELVARRRALRAAVSWDGEGDSNWDEGSEDDYNRRTDKYGYRATGWEGESTRGGGRHHGRHALFRRPLMRAAGRADDEEGAEEERRPRPGLAEIGGDAVGWDDGARDGFVPQVESGDEEALAGDFAPQHERRGHLERDVGEEADLGDDVYAGRRAHHDGGASWDEWSDADLGGGAAAGAPQQWRGDEVGGGEEAAAAAGDGDRRAVDTSLLGAGDADAESAEGESQSALLPIAPPVRTAAANRVGAPPPPAPVYAGRPVAPTYSSKAAKVYGVAAPGTWGAHERRRGEAAPSDVLVALEGLAALATHPENGKLALDCGGGAIFNEVMQKYPDDFRVQYTCSKALANIADSLTKLKAKDRLIKVTELYNKGVFKSLFDALLVSSDETPNTTADSANMTADSARNSTTVGTGAGKSGGKAADWAAKAVGKGKELAGKAADWSRKTDDTIKQAVKNVTGSAKAAEVAKMVEERKQKVAAEERALLMSAGKGLVLLAQVNPAQWASLFVAWLPYAVQSGASIKQAVSQITMVSSAYYGMTPENKTAVFKAMIMGGVTQALAKAAEEAKRKNSYNLTELIYAFSHTSVELGRSLVSQPGIRAYMKQALLYARTNTQLEDVARSYENFAKLAWDINKLADVADAVAVRVTNTKREVAGSLLRALEKLTSDSDCLQHLQSNSKRWLPDYERWQPTPDLVLGLFRVFRNFLRTYHDERHVVKVLLFKWWDILIKDRNNLENNKQDKGWQDLVSACDDFTTFIQMQRTPLIFIDLGAAKRIADTMGAGYNSKRYENTELASSAMGLLRALVEKPKLSNSAKNRLLQDGIVSVLKSILTRQRWGQAEYLLRTCLEVIWFLTCDEKQPDWGAALLIQPSAVPYFYPRAVSELRANGILNLVKDVKHQSRLDFLYFYTIIVQRLSVAVKQ